MFDAGRRRIRLRGHDEETGENFGAELYLPEGDEGFGIRSAILASKSPESGECRFKYLCQPALTIMIDS